MGQGEQSSRSEAKAREVILDMYEDLLQAVWSKSTYTLGIVAMESLLRQAIAKSSSDYLWLEHLKVDRKKGPVLVDLRPVVSEIDPSTLKQGFREVILSMLTMMNALIGREMAESLSGTVALPLLEKEPGSET